MAMKLPAWARAAVGLLAVTLPVAPAAAYVRTLTGSKVPVQWPDACVTILADTGNPPAPLTSVLVEKAVRGAAAAWSYPTSTCTKLKLGVMTKAASNSPAEVDHVNHVAFRQQDWCHVPAGAEAVCYDKNTLAITSVTANKGTGDIVDADIEVNAVYFTWGDLLAKPTPGSQDLQTVLTHELGHLIGLDHTCNAAMGAVDNNGQTVPKCSSAPRSVQATIMYPSTVSASPIRRVLSSDELRAICEVYPKGTGVPCAAPPARDGGATDARTDAKVDARVAHADGGSGGSDDGGCGGSPSKTDAHRASVGLLPFTFALALGTRRRRRR